MTTYKGYGITKIHNDRYIISLNGKNINAVTGSLSCVHHCIDLSYEDLTPCETYEGYEIRVSNGITTVSENGIKKKVFQGNASDAKFFIDAWLLVQETETAPLISIKERQKKSESYWKTWNEEYGETMRYTEEEKDLIQKYEK